MPTRRSGWRTGPRGETSRLFEELSRQDIERRIAASHADVRDIYDYWRSKLTERGLPRRADIDPLEIRRFLGAITIVDVVPDARRFVYRLVGTLDAAIRGYDPTGKSVAEAFFGGTLEETLSCYEYVVRTAGPFCYRDPYPVSDGNFEQDDLIYLPLSDDGCAVSNVLIFCHSYHASRRSGGSAF